MSTCDDVEGGGQTGREARGGLMSTDASIRETILLDTPVTNSGACLLENPRSSLRFENQ